MYDSHYIMVMNPCAGIMLRVPWPTPPWRSGVLKALTTVMHAHGMKQRDVSGLEGLCRNSPDQKVTDADAREDARIRARADAAFAGDPTKFAKFWLYDWHNGQFALARKGDILVALARKGDILAKPR